MSENPEFNWNWHHEYVSGVLQKFISKGSDLNKLMIFMPPQHQKTTMMVHYLIPFLFGHNHNAEVLLCMYNSGQASKLNKKVQKVMLDERYINMFGKLIGAKTENEYKETMSMGEFQIIDSYGFMKSAGVGAGIAGTPAKFTFMDDVIKNAAEANSITYRNNTYDWFTDEVEARQHNDSKIAFTITRRHEDDLAGRILKRDGRIEDGGLWTVITLPAIKEDNTNPNDPRKIGEALFPELHSLKRLEDIRTKVPTTFIGLYQQRPFKAGGNIIKKKDIQIVDEFDLPVSAFDSQINTVSDTAYTKDTQNDPCAFMSYFVWKGDLYVTDYKFGHWEISEYCRQALYFMELNCNQRSMLYIEPKATGKSAVQRIKEITSGNINVSEFEMVSGDKLAKLSANQSYFESGRIKCLKGPWNQHFIDEITGFPKMPNDEAVDCINMAITQGLERSNIKPYDYSDGIGSA